VDVFAAGIILYELLTKQKPFPKATDVESLIESRKAKVVPPTAIDPRLPKDVDAIVAKALAYDPDKRYSDARSFADALVDVLFPTPHSAIEDHLATQMQQVFADKIQRARAARAHDPLIMKVLYNAAQQEAQSDLSPKTTPLPGGFAPVETWTTPPRAPMRGLGGRRPQVPVRGGLSAWQASLIGLAVAGAAAAGLHYGMPWLRPGAVIVTSDPSGLEIALDGASTSLTTPAVVEDVVLSRPHRVTLSGPGVKNVTVAVPVSPGKLVARVHARVESSLGAIVIESEPPGASVQLDGQAAGTTPVTLRHLRLDSRHRLDLALPGYEVDQFVVLPEKDGQRYVRRLVRGDGKGRRPRGAP
jgi:hypothetical protein